MHRLTPKVLKQLEITDLTGLEDPIFALINQEERVVLKLKDALQESLNFGAATPPPKDFITKFGHLSDQDLDAIENSLMSQLRTELTNTHEQIKWGDNFEQLAKLAYAKRQNKEFKEALDIYNQLLALNETKQAVESQAVKATLLIDRAKTHADSGDFTHAIADCDAAAKLDPSSKYVWNGCARIYDQRAKTYDENSENFIKYKKLQEECLNKITNETELGITSEYAYIVKYRETNYENARHDDTDFFEHLALQKELKLENNFSDQIKAVKLAYQGYRLRRLAIDSKEPDKKKQYYKEMLQLYDESLAITERADLLNECADACFALQDYQRAIAYHTRIILFRPTAMQFIFRGLCYTLLKQMDLARKDFAAACERDLRKLKPGETFDRELTKEQQYSFCTNYMMHTQITEHSEEKIVSLIARGKYKTGDGKYREAIQLFTECLSGSTLNNEVYAERGDAFFQLRKYQEAYQDLNTAIWLYLASKRPKSTLPFWEYFRRRRNIQLKLGQLEGALSDHEYIEYLAKTSKFTVDHAEFANALVKKARALISENQPEWAIEYLLKSLKIYKQAKSKECLNAFLELTTAYHMINEPVKAKSAYEAATQLMPRPLAEPEKKSQAQPKAAIKTEPPKPHAAATSSKRKKRKKNKDQQPKPKSIEVKQEVQTVVKKIIEIPMQEWEKTIIKNLKSQGYKAALGGSSVRDRIQNKTINPKKDIDIVTSAPKEVILKCFPKAYEIETIPGLFKIITPEGLKIDIFSDNDLSQGFEVYARKLDFTINALFADENGLVTDPLNRSLNDLENSKVVSVNVASISFNQDPIRMLRALHASNTPHFEIAEEVRDGIRVQKDGLKDLIAEQPVRINSRLFKMFTNGNAEISFKKLIQHNLLGILFPNASKFLIKDQDWIVKILQETDRLPYISLNYIYMCFVVSVTMQSKFPDNVTLHNVMQENRLFDVNFSAGYPYEGIKSGLIKRWNMDHKSTQVASAANPHRLHTPAITVRVTNQASNVSRLGLTQS